MTGAIEGPAIDHHVIARRYTVVERIGKGAMGVVYKAHDAVLDRHVAMKQMVAELVDDDQLRQRFTQEARAAGKLNHPNIITIYELLEADGEIYIVMELLEGVDLATLMKRKVDLPFDSRINLMMQVCDGLDYAHARGIVHRDIKPANLHVSPSGVVKILDFGIARLAASKMTSTGGLIGTPDYMSPEQIMAGAIDARADLFAIGAVTYELVSGHKPFEAESVTALLMKILREPHVPLVERMPQLPRAAIDLVERLLAKNPADRPQSAAEVRQALAAISSGRSTLDSSTLEMLSHTIAAAGTSRTPVPTRPFGVAGATRQAPASDSSARLASLALDRGRALHQAGDLSGAMKVFRSVLELAPGNTEALRELEALEDAVSRLSASGAVAAAPPATRLATPVGAPPTGLPPPIPDAARTPGVAAPARRARLDGRLVGAGIAAPLLALLAWTFWPTNDAPPAQPSDTRAVVSTPTSSGVGASRPAPDAPAPLPGPRPAPGPVPLGDPPSTLPPSPRPLPSPRAPSGGRTSGGDRVAPTPDPTPAAPEPAPVVAPPVEPAPVAAAPPPADTTRPPEASAATVRHVHGRALFKGKFSSSFCEGTIELLPDGLYFRTTQSTDKRKDDKKITFASVEEYELEGTRLHIEADNNWDFEAPSAVLQPVFDRLKAHVKQ
ncbi:MAG: serine/threonine-protein kinase [Vicinamibacterales bacterium]